MSQKKFRFMFSIYFIIFGIVITLFSSLIGYKLQMIGVDENVEKSAQEIAYIKKTISLKQVVDKMDMLVVALASNKSLIEYIKHPDKQKEENLINLFFAITMTDKYIMQTRFLDENGFERVRIDRLNMQDTPFVVEKAKLQDKSKRDYFLTIKNLKSDQIWHSKLDLNIENGKVEVPFRPTIRVAKALFVDNHFKGAVIINILATELLDSVRKSTVFEHYIVDKDGYFILHPEDKYSWSKYTNSSRRIYDDFPTQASAILNGESRGEDFYAFSLNDILNNTDKAIFVLKPKAEYRYSLVMANIKTTIFVLLLSILISIPLALYASLVPSKLQKALVNSNSELKRFAEIIDNYVLTITTKKSSIITSVSKAFLRSCGYSKEEVIGQKMSMFRHRDTPEEHFVKLWNSLEKGEKWFSLVKNQKKDGTFYWYEQNIIPIEDEEGNVHSYMSIGTDVTAKKELEKLSVTDKLTGLYNRRQLDTVMVTEIERANRYKKSLSLLIIDIDFFKKVNDVYGHQVGDETLIALAKILSDNVRLSDIVGRFGGEEFLIILPETNISEAQLLAEKLRLAVEKYEFHRIGHATISIGVAQYELTTSEETLIYQADSALYKAKANGRNCVVCA
ncbi:MAG: diguanylate cyclase [Candidatus Marinarcus sp.]|uniref:sensor domain-containing diguanylate cyclase n=1 Tax=Candidatus Marinarcus sp. TaxID=3100987 RepID=UPI003B004D47